LSPSKVGKLIQCDIAPSAEFESHFPTPEASIHTTSPIITIPELFPESQNIEDTNIVPPVDLQPFDILLPSAQNGYMYKKSRDSNMCVDLMDGEITVYSNKKKDWFAIPGFRALYYRTTGLEPDQEYAYFHVPKADRSNIPRNSEVPEFWL